MDHVQISTSSLDRKGPMLMGVHMCLRMFMCNGMGVPAGDPVLKHMSL